MRIAFSRFSALVTSSAVLSERARPSTAMAKIVKAEPAQPWKPRHYLAEIGYPDVPPEVFDPDPADLDWIDDPLDPSERKKR